MLQQVARQTNKLPKALAKRPAIFPDMQYYHEAFWELSFQRPNNGFGVLPIPYTEIVAYCDLNEIKERQMFSRFIKAADIAYILYLNRKESSG